MYDFVKIHLLVQLLCFSSSLLYCAIRGIKWLVVQIRRHVDLQTLMFANILFMLLNLFIIVMQMEKMLWPVQSYFIPPITGDQRTKMLGILKVFQSQLDRHNIHYFMGAGTLIGSYRHHGPIPWDDDIDIYVKSSEKLAMVRAMNQLKPHFLLYGDSLLDRPSEMWKFFNPNSSFKYLHRPFTWPYVDIYFYRENATHVWDETGYWTLPRSSMYPLVRRPFGDTWLPSPCNVSEVLSSYRINYCQSRSFSHLFEVPIFHWRQRIVDCERLAQQYPFVYVSHLTDNASVLKMNTDTTIAGVVQEVLRIGGYSLHSVIIKQPPCDGAERSLK